MINKILLVEDELITALDLLTYLELLGYNVSKPVVNGEEAIRSALEEKPSIILMDINLIGKIDGIEAVEKIREHENIPVIYMTGYSNQEMKDRAMKTEPLAYLEKPVNVEEIKRILNRMH